jgi:hypothetical protein
LVTVTALRADGNAIDADVFQLSLNSAEDNARQDLMMRIKIRAVGHLMALMSAYGLKCQDMPSPTISAD